MFPSVLGLCLGFLEEGINLDEFNSGAFANVRLEEILDCDVLCTRGHLDGFGSSHGSIVVFQDCRLDGDLFLTG